ncbi:GH36 C-terminal domain-containing protein [Cohnella nanjingensis]|uniref:GH36 C-terminal domain-containing protein n=1 Tax=Cohnella nanjingensis TaxID=1387779 RepID=A0A7X0RP17_9BACL|nr:GH36 C-terminal domain-containing protein [Cohnella nanjingensis]MBB6670813.1 GH36 C-terminal domain-containing protein [Cohnella nanjingensis]
MTIKTEAARINLRTPLLSYGGIALACFLAFLFLFASRAFASGPYSASAGFSSTQGQNQWYYQQRPVGGGPFTDLTYTGGAWRGGNGNWLGAGSMHPDNSYDVVLKWTAPAAGTISITGTVRKNDTGGGNGVVAAVQKNGTVLWSKTIAFNDSTGYNTNADLSSVAVAAGDAIYFIVNNNGEYTYDETDWDPTIAYVDSWTASAGFSNIQGQNQWYYQQRPIGGGAFTNLTYSGGSGVWVGGNGNWLGGGAIHPDNTNDVALKWVAPRSGTICISGNVHKNDTGGGNGVVATVQKNVAVLWSRTIAYNDSTGYSTNADLCSVYVSAGDAIYFIVNNNGDYTHDETGWNPTIAYVAGTMPSWHLNTDDTNLTLTISGNRPAITQLKNPSQNWDWTPVTSVLPLLDRIYIGSTAYTPNWSYQGALVDTSSGTKVTLTFVCTTPNLTLTQVWWARPGAGPVEQTMAITNNTGGNVTYQYSDVVAADLTVSADNNATLWRFARQSMAGDPGFNTGVFKQLMGASTTVPSEISNNFDTGPYVLPFTMLDVNAVHGLYFGYTWDFGRFTNWTSGNAYRIRNKFYLGDAGSVTIVNGKAFNVPGMFFGTYKGDTDDGSNKMKKWFWNYKITPTLKANANEPLTEFGIDLYTEGEFSDFLSRNPLASWGVEMIKEDAYYTTDGVPPGSPYANGQPQPNYDPFFGWAWTPAPVKWPNGMTLGTIAHNNGVKLSLYLANRYNHANLATQAGRDSQKAALQSRFDNWQFDYWRSDMEFEPTGDYLSHEGFLEVLDYMIANRPGFRWENCSAGGSKKSFDLLQRQTVMTTEDSGGNPGSILNYRKAFYANSYMINPVQLKDDNGEDLPGMKLWEYEMRGGFLGAWMWAGDYSNTDPVTVDKLNSYKAHLDLYKTKQRPILRGADVYHVLPMPDGTHWDGMQFFNASMNKGSVLLFKPNSGVGNSPTIYLKGLDPNARYTLTFQDRTTLNASYSNVLGSQLMAGGTGISVSGNAGDYDSEIIWIN